MPAKPPLMPTIKQFARELRQRQTDAEQLLWSLLRGRRLGGFKFRRQHPFRGYILDFYCEEIRLVVELDGGQHNTEQGKSYDSRRSDLLRQEGIRVLRFWNHEVLTETESILEVIWAALHDQPNS